jgi:hypothetical protein
MKLYFNATLKTNCPLIEAFFSHRRSPLEYDHNMSLPAKPTNTNNTVLQLSAPCHRNHHPSFHQQTKTTTTTMSVDVKALPQLLLS